MYEHPWVWFLCWAVTFVCLVTLAYNERARRTQPTNYVTLCVSTVQKHAVAPHATSCNKMARLPSDCMRTTRQVQLCTCLCPCGCNPIAGTRSTRRLKHDAFLMLCLHVGILTAYEDA